MKPRTLTRSVAGGLALGVVATAGLATTAGATSTAPTTATSSYAAEPVPTVHVQPDPSYQQPAFEGWGTSLVWFANATGGYPDEIRERLADLLFGEDGLRLNIARYNIGGGNAPDVKDYLRPGGAVPGWWQAPAGTTRTDVDWWSADDPRDWNLDADQAQRWWIDRIKPVISKWETFSNSPPWFMTESGYVSGGFDSSADQLKTSSINAFAQYLVKVTEHIEDAHSITVDTLDPFNEPNTPYWGTRLGADGQPTGGRQEGAHMGPELQQQVVRALAPVLEASETDAKISAMDETNPSTFTRNWMSYPADVKDAVDQLNVHTYGTGQRTSVRDLAKSDAKPLWMSEVEGSWGNGQSFTSMAPGLGMAQRITDDLRELEPSAWVFWQPVEDFDNMKPGGESAAGANWGSIQLPFDCTAEDTLATCPIRTNQKFNTVRNFTHYIEPGDHVVKVNDTNTVAAVDAAERTATLVHTNSAATARDVVVDLSMFGKIGPKATLTAIVSDKDAALRERSPVAVTGTTATVRVPAESVTTIVVSEVRGLARNAALVQEGHTYRLTGVQSGKSLSATEQGAVIRTSNPAAPDQLWTIRQLSGGVTNRERHQVLAHDGRQVAVRDGKVVLEAGQGSPDDDAQWYLSTTGDGSWTLASAVGPNNLEVGGGSTAEGADVSVWQPNSGDNQRWAITDESVRGIHPVTVFTVPGVRPALPDTVTPARAGSGSGTLPVSWDTVPDARYDRPGIVKVRGTATDPATGATYPAAATVTVDTVSGAATATASTYAGGTPTMPDTATATTDTFEVDVQLPVTWSLEGTSFDSVGEVQVPGTAALPDGSTVDAVASVTVTEAVEANVALRSGTTASATYTEPGYSPSRLVNGNVTDKAWSNWVSGTQRSGDTITLSLPEAHDLTRVTTRFYQDGSNVSYAKTIRVEAKVGDTWQPISSDITIPQNGAGAPVVDVPVTPTRASQVRVVLTANSYMTISEIEVLAKAAAA